MKQGFKFILALLVGLAPGLASAADAKHLRAVMPALKVTIVDGATHAGERAVQTRPKFVNALREFIDGSGKK